MGNRFVNKKLPMVIFFAYLLVSFLYLSRLVFDVDEGIALYNAWQFLNGNTAIYTEKFIDYISPGTGLSVFLVWRLFGTAGYFTAHLLFLGFWGLGLIGLVLIIRGFRLKPAPSLLMILYWLMIFGFTSRINHNAFAASLAVLTIFQILNFVKGQRSALLLSAGITTAVALWYLQTVGLALFLSIVAILVFTKKKPHDIVTFVSSFFLTAVPLLSITGLERTIRALFVMPFFLGYPVTNADLSRPHLAIIALAIVSFMYLYARRTKKPAHMALFIFQAALFIASSNSFNRAHFLVNSMPFAIFTALILSDIKSGLKPTTLPNSTLLANIATAVVGSFVLFSSFQNLSKPKTYEYARYNKFSSPQIRKANNIYAGPYLPAVYYYAGKNTAYSLSHTDVADKKSIDRVLGEIKSVKPEIAFLNYDIIPRLNIDRNNPIDIYIRKHYLLCGQRIYGTEMWAVDKKYCLE